MLLGDFLNKLKKAKSIGKGEYQALCPAHADRNPSLHVKLADGKILIDCKAGCTAEAIVQALGLTMADLFIEHKTAKPEVKAEVVATYDYKDENGQPLFQVVRYEPKSFRQRHENGNHEWVWNLDGVRRVLYHLPEILQSTDTIYLTEGEKDADNLWMWGKVATTSPGGANGWKPEYANSLIGKRVVIIPDKDDAGYNYARTVARTLQSKASEVRTIILPGPAKDISDWLDAGGDIETLASLEREVSVLFNQAKLEYHVDDNKIYWEKSIGLQVMRFQAEKLSEERTGVHARITIFLDTPLSWSSFNIERREDRSSLATAAHSILDEELKKNYSKDDLRRDLDTFCAGLWDFSTSLLSPELVAGDDELKPLDFYLSPYLLCDGGSILYAPPGRGKSYSALLWAVCIDAGNNKFWEVKQSRVLFINLERSRKSLSRRLAMINKVLGLPLNRPLLMLNARGKSLAEVAASCRRSITEHSVKVIILDSISRAGVGDLTEGVSGNRIVDMLSSLCPSWLALGHTSRASDEHIYGSIFQDAGADICVQLSSQITADGTLGIGWEITKQNDTGTCGQEVLAFEFGLAHQGLTAIRKARDFEFPELVSKTKQSMGESIIDFILEQEGADSTATQIAKATGLDRGNISRYLKQSGKFVETRKVKQSVYYGVKENRDALLP